MVSLRIGCYAKLSHVLVDALRKFCRVGNDQEDFTTTEAFDSLNTALLDAGLRTRILGHGDKYIASLALSIRFTSEIVQPACRARFGQNLANLTGLTATIAVRDLFSKKATITGGNKRLVEELINFSEQICI
jgi:hypothetical protein